MAAYLKNAILDELSFFDLELSLFSIAILEEYHLLRAPGHSGTAKPREVGVAGRGDRTAGGELQDSIRFVRSLFALMMLS